MRDASSRGPYRRRVTGTGTPQTRRGNATGLVCALVGIAVAIAAVLVFDQLSVRGEIPFAVQTPLSYLVTWVPMGGAVGVFAAMRRRAARATLRVGIRWIDLLWGGAIGIGCRMVAIGTSYVVYGSAGLSGAASIGGAITKRRVCVYFSR